MIDTIFARLSTHMCVCVIVSDACIIITKYIYILSTTTLQRDRILGEGKSIPPRFLTLYDLPGVHLRRATSPGTSGITNRYGIIS